MRKTAEGRKSRNGEKADGRVLKRKERVKKKRGRLKVGKASRSLLFE